MFRGEHKLYPTVIPSLYRLPAHERTDAGIFITNLVSHLLDDILWPSLDFEADGAYFRGNPLGDPEIITQVRSDVSYLDSAHQLQALFQHYGWPTNWLDVTYDVRVAMFFASFNFASNQLETKGEGHIYWWESSKIYETFFSNVDIIDLRHLSALLAGALNAEATRPSRQNAAAIKMGLPIGLGLNGFDERMASIRNVVKFQRHDVADVVDQLEHYYPPDGLKVLLESFQRKYLRWAKNYSNEHPDDRINVDWGQNFADRIADAQKIYWERRQYSYRDVERLNDCAFDLAYHGQIVSAASKLLGASRAAYHKFAYDKFEDILRGLNKASIHRIQAER